MSTAAPPIPAVGQVVRCRGRAWLVDAIEPSPHGTVLALSCLEDDSQGEQARVIWEAELGTSIIDEEAWRSIGSKNGARAFDDTRFFSAFYRTLRWNCVTATDPKLFQSPFRAGIRVEPYQLEPLRKALLLPRVNLFIADDVGLGKTIEAGLIASELLLRRRVRDIVVVCPPSMLSQWQYEFEARFGLVFQVLDRPTAAIAMAATTKPYRPPDPPVPPAAALRIRPPLSMPREPPNAPPRNPPPARCCPTIRNPDRQPAATRAQSPGRKCSLKSRSSRLELPMIRVGFAHSPTGPYHF